MRVLMIVNDPNLSQAQPYLTLKPGDEILQIAPSDDNLEQIRQARPDLVLVDAAMRETSAPELAAQAHDDLSLRDIPVFLVPGLERQAETGASPSVSAGSADEAAATPVFGTAAELLSTDCMVLERQILNNLDQAVVVIELDGTIVYWNRFAENLYGVPAEKVLGHSSAEVLGRRSKFYRDQVIPYLHNGKRWTMEYFVRRPDGRMRPVLLTVSPLYNQDQTLIGLTEIAIDISERKENDSRYQRALFNAPFPVIIHAEDGEVIMLNRAWTELSGFEPGHMPRIEDWVEKVYEPDQREPMLEAIRQGFDASQRVTQSVEREIKTLNGGRRIWSFSSAPLGTTLDGRRTRITMAVDLTDRKQAENRFELAVMESPLPISMYAEDGEMLLINRAWTHLTGYTLDDIPTSQAWTEKAYREQAPDVQRTLENVRWTDGQMHVGEFNVYTKDGRQRAWDFSTVSLGRLPDGRRYRMSIASDLTDRREVEKRFRRSIEESPFPIVLYAAEDGEMLLVSRAWTEITGYTIQDIPTLDVWVEKAYRGQQERAMSRIRQAIPLDERTHLGEFTVHTKDDRQRLWDIYSVSPGRLPDGRRLRMTIATDITERKVVEQRFEQAVENAPFPLALYAEDGEVILLNQAFSDYTGYVQADLPNLDIWLQKAFRDRYPMMREWMRQMEAQPGMTHEGEFSIWTKDQYERVWDIDGVWLGRLPDGRRLRMLMAVDLTDRKEMEQRFAQAVKYAPFPLSIYAEDGEMILVNQAFMDLTGYSLLDIPNLSDYAQKAHLRTGKNSILQEAARTQEKLIHLMSPDQPQRVGELTLTVRDGRQRVWDTIAVPIGHLPDGRRLRMAMASDITERKEIEMRFEQAVTESPFPLALYTVEDGEMMLLNRTWTNLSGYSLEDIPTLNDWLEKAFGERRNQVWEAMLQGRLQPGAVNYGEFLLRTKDGHQRLWDFSAVSLGRLSDGRQLRMSIAADITEREEIEERFRRAVENAPFPIIIYAQDGEVIALNQAWTEQTGYTLADLPTMNDWVTKAYAETSPEILADHRQMLSPVSIWQQQIDFPQDYLICTKDGRQLTWNFSSSPLGVLPDGRRLVISMAADLTERKRIEDALRESENRYRQVVELSNMLIATLTGERLTFINTAGAHLLGFESPQEIIARPISELIDPASYRRLIELARSLPIEQLIQQNENRPGGPSALVVEEEIIRLDSSRVVFSASLNFMTLGEMPGERGEFSGLITHIIAQDYTVRQQARLALGRQAALAVIDVAISRPTELEAGLEKVIQVACDALAARIGVAVVLWDSERRGFRLAASSMSEEHTYLLERLMQPVDGLSAFIAQEKKPWLVQDITQDGFDPAYFAGTPVRSYAAIPVMVDYLVQGVLYVFQDQPDAFSLGDEQFLSALAHRLGLAVGKVDLYENIRKARDAAEDASRAKADFLANMSHELRTPLTTITTLAELLLESSLDSVQSNYTQTIFNSAGRLLDLINRVLDFSRLEAHKLTLTYQPFDLRRTIEAALDLAAVQAAQKGLFLEYSAGMDAPYRLVGDSIQLGQVLTNLLSNAIKFTESGVISLKVERVGPAPAEGESPTCELLFTLQDTGTGIPPDRIPLLFQPFSQVDTSPTRRYTGSGLGLVISKHIVELMGGRIWLESDGRSGTTFYFTIHLEPVQEEPPAYLHSGQPWMQGKQVLILTGSNLARQALGEWVAYWGGQAHSFARLNPALHWLKDHPVVDIALADAHYLDPDQASPNLCAYFDACQSNRSALIALLPFGERVSLPDGIGSLTINPLKPGALYGMLSTLLLEVGKSNTEVFELPGDSRTEQESARVLLAEDDPLNRQALGLRLQRLGYTVDAVANGLEAIQAIAEGGYDIVFMDYQMPEMDGLFTTRYVRENYPTDRQPFIIGLTADARQEARDALLAAGANLYLTKPARGEDLVLALRQAIAYLRSERQMGPGQGWLVQPTQPKPSEPIDEAIFSDLVESIGGDDLRNILALLELFFENSKKLIEAIRDNLAEQNWQQMRNNLHTLKGSSELLGAKQLGKWTKQMETLAAQGRADDLESGIEKLVEEYGAARLALERRYQQIKETTRPTGQVV